MPCKLLKDFLDVNNVKYTSTKHSLAFTAQDIAQAAHLSGWDLAKTVIVVVDGLLAMVVVPASRPVNLDQVQAFTGAREVGVATESDFRELFADCEEGAMPPFGNLYGLQVYVDESLEGTRLTFNAGTHRELFTIEWEDFERLVKPALGHFIEIHAHALAGG